MSTYTIPNVIAQNPRGDRIMDVYSHLLTERVVYLGFEVRVDLLLGDGERLWAQVTRDEADRLKLTGGSLVFVRPSRTRVFAGGAG